MMRIAIRTDEESQEREKSLRALAERWHGDITAYLDALAELREASSAESSNENLRNTHTVLRSLVR